MMTEADKVSELHQEVKNSLLNEDLEKVKNWQKDAYHKQIMGGFKETKEAEDGFRKAQKPWAKKMKEVPQTGGAGGVSQEGIRGEGGHTQGPARVVYHRRASMEREGTHSACRKNCPHGVSSIQCASLSTQPAGSADPMTGMSAETVSSRVIP